MADISITAFRILAEQLQQNLSRLDVVGEMTISNRQGEHLLLAYIDSLRATNNHTAIVRITAELKVDLTVNASQVVHLHLQIGGVVIGVHLLSKNLSVRNAL